jgi:hypothetical protein
MITLLTALTEVSFDDFRHAGVRYVCIHISESGYYLSLWSHLNRANMIKHPILPRQGKFSFNRSQHLPSELPSKVKWNPLNTPQRP